MPEIGRIDDTYTVTVRLPAGEVSGATAREIVTLDIGDEIIDIVWTIIAADEGVDTLQQTLNTLDSIGDDAAALASAQAALAIPAPVNPGDIDHNDLASRDAAAAHPADAIEFTPAGDIAATDVQAAIEELDSEKLTKRIWDTFRPLLIHPMGLYGWTTSASGSAGQFINRAKWSAEQRATGVLWAVVAQTGTTTTGTNASSASGAQRGLLWLFNGFRILFRINTNGLGNHSTFRFGVWTNDPTVPVATTGRPSHGIWLEKDTATNGNSNWWLCAANGSTVSTADTGIATTTGERIFVLDFESTASLKAWELNTSEVAEVASLTTNLPSGGASNVNRNGVAFWQQLSANTGTNSYVLFLDVGLLDNTCPSVNIPE